MCRGTYVYGNNGGQFRTLDEAKTACDKKSTCKCISLQWCDKGFGYNLHYGTGMKTSATSDCSWVNISVKTEY